MKLRILTITFTLAAGMALTSCDSDTLSARSARKAIEKEALFRDSSQVEVFDVGYYEIDSTARASFEALAKEGVITCKITEVTEHHKYEKYTWWEGTKVYYEDVRHYFAQVALTDEGKKYVVANQPVRPADEENIPDYEFYDSLDTLSDSGYLTADTVGAGDDTAADAAETKAKTTDESYQKELNKVSFTTVKVLVGFYKIEKVFDVQCPEDYRKAGIGKCRFITLFKGVTPFGTALTDHREGERSIGNANLVRYEDKGWRVDTYDISSEQSTM